MLLSVSIMACPARAKLAERLAAQLGDAPIAMDPVRYRARGESVWPVRRAALELHDPSARFHLVLQDDAILGRDFLPRLHALFEREGEGKAYSLYYRHVPPRTVHRQVPERGYYGPPRASYGPQPSGAAAALRVGGFDWPNLMFGVAVVLPTRLIADLVEACDEMTRVRADDVRLQYFLRCRKVPTHYPLPSLVDHRPELEGRNGRNRHRRAAWFR